VPDARPLDLPKVELHLHLDGNASYPAVAALAPEVTLAEYRNAFVGPERFRDLPDLLAHYSRILELMQDERGLRVMVEDLFEQLARDRVIYAEIRFAPLQHTGGGLSPRDVVTVVERTAAESIAATGVEARLILCTLRHFAPEQSMETAHLAAAFEGSLVTGFDIAGDEAGHPLDAHEPAFRFAGSEGVRLTAHAGEAAGPASVDETLRRLQPARIGHGVRSIEDAALVERLRRDRIHLEVCPSSNVQIGLYPTYGEHPVDRLRRAGVPLSVNTDQRTITDLTLSREYDRVRAAFGWTDDDFDACNRLALEAAFVDDETRARLLARLGPVRAADGPGPSIQTVSGRRLNPFDPDPDQIDPNDIARALSNQCRFGGHSRVFYSVAQHSAIVSDLVLDNGGGPDAALAALLHDAAEAYLVDLPHPLKHRSALGPPYRRAEAVLEEAIRKRFSLPRDVPGLKPIDRALLATERRTFSQVAWHWPELEGAEPLDLELAAWEPARAAREFLARFERLQEARSR
jgi:adenosine deaminase